MPPRCQLLSGSLPIPSRCLRTTRTFTTSSALYKAKGGDLGSHLPKHVIPQDAIIPKYPYGPALLFKQSNKGLYGGQTIQFGNNVSDDTETKTRRHWKPNVLTKSLYSIALKKKIKLRVTSKVLKTMDREGGLDEYLLKESETRIKELGPTGWQLRWFLMQQPVIIARLRAEAAAIGLAQDIIDQQWPKRPTIKRTQREAIAKQKREETLAEEQERETRVQEGRYQRSKAINAFSEAALRKGLAPKRAAAKKMGIADADRYVQLMKSIRNRSTVLAYMRAERMGTVEKAGGGIAWLARYNARRAYQLLKQQEREPEPLPESEEPMEEIEEPIEEKRVYVKKPKKSKDGWGDLVKANKGNPSVDASA